MKPIDENNYETISLTNYPGRDSEDNLYLREVIEPIDLKNVTQAVVGTFALLGYACDEGVKRNQGREGAKNGPQAVRNQLGKLTNHLGSEKKIVDYGNLLCVNDHLELIQHNLSTAVYQLLQYRYFPIIIGGSHDLSYGHFNGVKRYVGSTERIGIFNFDTHFDLRKPNPQPNSGTPFYQIFQEAGNQVYYFPIGIQKKANHRQLFETANEHQVSWLELSQCNSLSKDSIKSYLLQSLSRVDRAFITIDMDCFSAADSPGVSATNPLGLRPDFVIELLHFLLQSTKITSVDIVETNPTVDIDNRTAKLAAELIWQILHH